MKKNKNKKESISIRGARVHNLKNISLDIPKNKIVVVTGPSGSGKSSLVFDTICAESQRRYLENISNRSLQFANVFNKPDVDQIEGLSPTISINDKSSAKSPRSTVGTIAEIYGYIRILFSSSGKAHCPSCKKELIKQTFSQFIKEISNFKNKTKITITSPLFAKDQIDFSQKIRKCKKIGLQKIIINKETRKIKDISARDGQKAKILYEAEVIIDEFLLEKNKPRDKSIIDSIEMACGISNGFAKVSYLFQKAKTSKELFFSKSLYCKKCGIAFPNIEPKLFSFNNPYGACRHCSGLGTKMIIDPELIIPNKSLTLLEGAIRPLTNLFTKFDEYIDILEKIKKKYDVRIDIPVEKMNKKDLHFVLYGSLKKRNNISYRNKNSRKDEEQIGVINILEQKYYKTNSDYIRCELEKYMTKKLCSSCCGKRLCDSALSVKICGKSISDITEMNISQEIKFFQEQEAFMPPHSKILTKEIIKRLKFLNDIGLGYLSLSRSSETISPGEARRIKLATQLSCRLQGILYVLDEPSIGLHSRDNEKLLYAMKKLKNLGNSILVIEHDGFFIRNADYIIDMGPKSGEDGGKVIAEGRIKDIIKSNFSATGNYLCGRTKIEVKKRNRKKNGMIIIKGASEHNLKNIDVKIPFGKLVCVTGVSGSGKSTLVNDVLFKSYKKRFQKSKENKINCKKIIWHKNIKKIINIDQSPIGRTPRSNPATYTGIFTHIRDLFAATKEARKRCYKAGHFSFNVRGGRCESCKGDGAAKIEMPFLNNVYVKCEDCGGKRYNDETLEIEYKGANIFNVLDMQVSQALEFFKNIPVIFSKLLVMKEVGLGYVKLGQSATTLSGGEAQRIKLVSELSRPAKEGKTLYILDEPTVGLHFEDVKKLLEILDKLVDKGNTVLIIEHNMEVIKFSDWIIDLGPDGGDKGGYIVAEGTSSHIAKCKKSVTGKYLKDVL